MHEFENSHTVFPSLTINTLSIRIFLQINDRICGANLPVFSGNAREKERHPHSAWVSEPATTEKEGGGADKNN